ncbi:MULTISPECIES: excinuclease ABC subunit UvrA [unclassified Corynebacterium]|uniref:excinuclease ABC subunit UvrA n=1 Tax=unclassified Corynebacterium TaxID=2624378 RepID=UPI002655C284|nr:MULTISPECIES: excinuclease ABC subunit UvrA [unclassified Corynebacterium]MDN8593670.1 excinuclease ABC subunit UvrA [Corynebacterium sp. P4_F2]WKK55790.1 excinuclease ABC subunit UvrA [Corynebacterium sp. P4-C1]WKK63198.1 excinuclease ABC subunit UvrA [Corynebacterium sp. P8-C1]
MPETTEASDGIKVRDAHLHNLRDVDVDIPRGTLVAVTGVSGSGKSSLAFGTIHGEGQRRYLESVAPFARRLIGSAVDPQVGDIEGLPPTVALQQSTSGGGARSTVGTVSALSNSIRLLYSRSGDNPKGLYSDSFSPNTPEGMCPECQGTGVVHEPTEQSMIPDPTLSIEDGAIQAWPGAWAGKNFHDILQTLGYDLDSPWQDLPKKDRDWILFTDERPVVTVKPLRGADQIQRNYEGTWRSVASYLTNTLAETQSDTLRKRVLSYMESRTCETCGGRRLNPEALKVTYAGMPIDELGALPLEHVHAVLAEQTPAENSAEDLLLKQILPALQSALDLGLAHLSLDRPAPTLSAGELQRIRLSAQLRSGLFGVAYVLDEPSAGLHPAERGAVLDICRRFINAGNSVLLVEHDMDLVAQTDWLVDVGPRAGERGGEVVYSGPTKDYAADTPTARALNNRTLSLNDDPRDAAGTLSLKGVRSRSIDGLDVDFGLGQFTAVAGVSGSGKSTLVSTVLAGALRETASAVAENDEDREQETGEWSVDERAGFDAVSRVVQITQKPIGRTPRSTLATYTGLFDGVRKLFASTPESKKRKWTVSRFSYNVKQGQCPTCGGAGKIEVELVFLPGSYTTCPDCGGARYNDETLEVTWEGRTIADVLQLTVDEAAEVFADEPKIRRAVATLQAVGLGYLKLGQGAPELSGGEAQRIKLATELQRSRNSRRGHTVYLLDEPTTGLHPADTELLVNELNGLVDAGQTVIVVEHGLSVIAQADRVIEMGPGAGADGGRIIADGTPAEVAERETATGRVLIAGAR